MSNTTANKDNTELFEAMPVPQALMKMAIPTIMGQLIVLIYNMADTFFIGRTGNPYMVAAASLILPVFNITISLANLAGVGGGALISRLLGAGRKDEARKVSGFCFYVAVGTSALFAVIIGLFMKPILTFMGAGPDTYDFAKAYAICVIVCGGIPTVISNTLATLNRSIGYSKEAGFGVMMGGILNMFLDPLFMFVLLPSGMEIIGAGAATCLSNCVACAYFLIILYRNRRNSVLTLRPDAGMPQAESIKSIFNVGIPSATTMFLFDMDYVVLDKLMAGYGDIALAAVGIVLKVERFPLNVGVGISQGMMPLAAYNYSSGNEKRRRKIISTARTAGLVVAGISIVVYLLLAGNIMQLFISNAETVALGTTFLRIRSLATPLMFLGFYHVYVFNGFGKGEIAFFLGTVRWLVFNIPMLFILNHFVGMYGLVWAQVTADFLTAVMSLYVYKTKG